MYRELKRRQAVGLAAFYGRRLAALEDALLAAREAVFALDAGGGAAAAEPSGQEEDGAAAAPEEVRWGMRGPGRGAQARRWPRPSPERTTRATRLRRTL
jgi:hypothetical protein